MFYYRIKNQTRKNQQKKGVQTMDKEIILTEEQLAKVSAGYQGANLTPEESAMSDSLWKKYKQAAVDCAAGRISRDEFNAAAQALARFCDKMDAKYGA